MHNRTYYDVLNLPKTASPAEINQAYNKLRVELSSKNTVRTRADGEALEKALQAIKQAYAVLSDPAKREAYDNECYHHAFNLPLPTQEHIPPQTPLAAGKIIYIMSFLGGMVERLPTTEADCENTVLNANYLKRCLLSILKAGHRIVICDKAGIDKQVQLVLNYLFKDQKEIIAQVLIVSSDRPIHECIDRICAAFRADKNSYAYFGNRENVNQQLSLSKQCWLIDSQNHVDILLIINFSANSTTALTNTLKRYEDDFHQQVAKADKILRDNPYCFTERKNIVKDYYPFIKLETRVELLINLIKKGQPDERLDTLLSDRLLLIQTLFSINNSSCSRMHFESDIYFDRFLKALQESGFPQNSTGVYFANIFISHGQAFKKLIFDCQPDKPAFIRIIFKWLTYDELMLDGVLALESLKFLEDKLTFEHLAMIPIEVIKIIAIRNINVEFGKLLLKIFSHVKNNNNNVPSNFSKNYYLLEAAFGQPDKLPPSEDKNSAMEYVSKIKKTRFSYKNNPKYLIELQPDLLDFWCKNAEAKYLIQTFLAETEKRKCWIRFYQVDDFTIEEPISNLISYNKNTISSLFKLPTVLKLVDYIKVQCDNDNLQHIVYVVSEKYISDPALASSVKNRFWPLPSGLDKDNALSLLYRLIYSLQSPRVFDSTFTTYPPDFKTRLTKVIKQFSEGFTGEDIKQWLPFIPLSLKAAALADAFEKNQGARVDLLLDKELAFAILNFPTIQQLFFFCNNSRRKLGANANFVKLITEFIELKSPDAIKNKIIEHYLLFIYCDANSHPAVKQEILRLEPNINAFIPPTSVAPKPPVVASQQSQPSPSTANMQHMFPPTTELVPTVNPQQMLINAILCSDPRSIREALKQGAQINEAVMAVALKSRNIFIRDALLDEMIAKRPSQVNKLVQAYINAFAPNSISPQQQFDLELIWVILTKTFIIRNILALNFFDDLVAKAKLILSKYPNISFCSKFFKPNASFDTTTLTASATTKEISAALLGAVENNDAYGLVSLLKVYKNAFTSMPGLKECVLAKACENSNWLIVGILLTKDLKNVLKDNPYAILSILKSLPASDYNYLLMIRIIELKLEAQPQALKQFWELAESYLSKEQIDKYKSLRDSNKNLTDLLYELNNKPQPVSASVTTPQTFFTLSSSPLPAVNKPSSSAPETQRNAQQKRHIDSGNNNNASNDNSQSNSAKRHKTP